ncbi:T9SS type A sorting domain-containing protein [Marivirga arenosa]|uniref:T9SS type A sorting domain-containing protein n=1 Tax=Marivirga arenosa TaxID=3059076 RepID=A0AA51N4U7_9BACT|nr:T9SS type A sorting domain-containing protein [Marivirga sp. ABR2-2]WMN06014.1 T9SS type A sorting domain-containing protein [Marivirga sp. ABR2-2]
MSIAGEDLTNANLRGTSINGSVACYNTYTTYVVNSNETNGCVFKYTWTATGGKFSNGANVVTGNDLKVVSVFWNSGESNYELELSAFQAFVGNCTPESIEISASIIPTFGGDAEVSPELSTLSFSGDEDDNGASGIICSNDGTIDITETPPSSTYDIQSRVRYKVGTASYTTIKDWTASTVKSISPIYTNLHVNVDFLIESRYTNCTSVTNSTVISRDFYKTPTGSIEGDVQDPSCDNPLGSLTYSVTSSNINYLYCSFINAHGSVSELANKKAYTTTVLPSRISGGKAYFDFDRSLTVTVSDPENPNVEKTEELRLVPGKWTVQIDFNIDDKDGNPISDYPCGRTEQFTVGPIPDISIEEFSADQDTLICYNSTTNINVKVSRNDNKDINKITIQDVSNNSSKSVKTWYDQASGANLSHSVGPGTYRLQVRYSDCDLEYSASNILITNQSDVDIDDSFQPSITSQPILCWYNYSAAIELTAKRQEGDQLDYKLQKKTSNNNWFDWQSPKSGASNQTVTFTRLNGGVYRVLVKYDQCTSWANEGNYILSNEIDIPYPPVITYREPPILQPPSCPGLEDGSIQLFLEGGTVASPSEYEIDAVMLNGQSVDKEDFTISGLTISGFGEGDEVRLTVKDANECSRSFTNTIPDITNPLTVIIDTPVDPTCFDGFGSISFTSSGGAISENNFSYKLVKLPNTCTGNFSNDCPDFNDENVFWENRDTTSPTISGIDPQNNATYVIQVNDGNCTIYSDEFSFNVPDQPQMVSSEAAAPTGGIKLEDDYYVQCKDDQIDITWPLNFDSSSGKVSKDFTITKDGETLEKDKDYTVYSDNIVLRNANVFNSTSTTYEITGTDGDGCTLSTADDSNLFILNQVEDEFKIDKTETKVKVWYKDKEDNDYHLKHAKDTNGTVFMKAVGGMLLDGSSQNYNYYLYDADEETLITESVEKGADDIYAFDSLLQAQKNYRFEIVDRLGCLKDSTFRLNAPDTLKIEITLNTSYAGGVNIACKNGTDTVKVQTSGGLYPHFVELKSGETTYFSQTIHSTEDTAIFRNVAAGNYYVQVTDKYDYSVDFQYITKTENFDLIEPTDSVDFEHEMREPSCFYSEDGELTITPSGGIPFPNDEYIIMFYNQEGTKLLDSIKGTSATFIDSAGFYKVEVYDANSFNYNTVCTVKNSVLEIENIPQLQTDTLYYDFPLCLGDSTGKIHVRATGGRSDGSYSFRLYDSNQTQIDSLIDANTNQHSFVSLFSGQYRVKITDTVGCEFSRDILLKEREDPLSIVNLQPIESKCSNTTDAAIKVTTTGGDGRHSLSINKGQSWVQLDSAVNDYQFTELVGGQFYEIWLKDENYYKNSYQSSCLIIDTVTIAKTDSVMLTSEVKQVSCFGGSDGSIKINASYGENTNTDIFKFEWYKNGNLLENETSDRLENLSRGSYTAKVTYDTIACSQKSLTVGILQPSKPFAIDTIYAQDYNCETTDPLKVQINLSGGWKANKYKVQIDNLLPDSIQIDEFESLSIYENLDYGEHQIRIWDAEGCEVSESFEINYQRPAIDNIAITNVSCNGESTGSIGFSGQYEIMDYYLWNDLTGTLGLEAQEKESVLFQGLAAGLYRIWSKKGNCISDTLSVTITEPSKLQINPIVLEAATCGQNNGGLDVEIKGGTPPYNINWLGGIDPAALGEGEYRVSVEDSLGCAVTSSIYMPEVSPIEIVIDSLKDSYCNLNNGFAKVSISEATPPYSIYWNGVEGEDLNSSLSPGTYEIAVVDALNCSQSISLEINEPLPVELTIAEYREADCDIANGYIRFEYDNLISPFEVIWPETLSPIDNYAANGLTAGVMYSLNLVDSAGCTHEFSFNIPDKSDLSLEFEVEKPSCENANGSLKAIVSGGSGNYSYSWSTGEEGTDAISNLAAGFYYLSVEDELGCKAVDSISLLDNPDAFPEYDIIKSDPSCNDNDGSIEVQFVNFDQNFEVFWPTSSIVANKREGLAAGIYTAVIQNADGCSEEIRIELAAFQRPELEVESIKMSSCGNSNGEIRLTEIPKLNYIWSSFELGSTHIADSLSAGNYWVYGENQDLCRTDTLFFTLDNVDSDIVIQTQSIVSTSCPNSNDGSIKINVSGGLPPYTYLWDDNGEQTQAEAVNLKAGNYTVLVTDANECATSKTFNLQSQNPVFIASFEQIEPQCYDSFDGSLTVNAGGGKGNYTYLWSNGDTTRTADSLAIGNYSVQVFDGSSCFAFEELTLTGPEPIAIQLESGPPVCRGEETAYANLNVAGGSGQYNILWDDGNTQESRSDLEAGSHLVSIQDANGCEREFEIIIPEQQEIDVEYTVIAPSCAGGSDGRIEINRILNASNPLVEWQDGNIGVIRENLTSGQYVYTIIDNQNCSIQDTIRVENPNPIEIVNEVIQNPLCFGQANGSITFDVEGGSGNYQYFWEDGSVNKNRTNLVDGTYALRIQDDNGCSLIREFVITQPDTISINYLVSPVSCFGDLDGAIDLDISGGSGSYTINWNDNETSENRENLAAGFYFVTVTDSNGCVNTEQILVPEPSPLDITVSKQQPSCNGGTDGQLSIEITGGNQPYEIEWQDGTSTNSLDSLTAGNYSVAIVDAKGCEFSTTISLNQPSILRVAEENTENPICYQEPTGYAEIVPTGGVGNYSIEWHDGDTLFIRNDLMAGVHNYTIYDGNRCSYDDQITLEDPDEINIEGLPEEVYLCGSGTLILDGGDKWTEFQWTSNNGFSEVTQEVEINQEGTYTLNTVNEDGCTDEYTFEVYKDDNLIDTDFLLTSDAIVGDTVIIVDVSWPVPDSTFWDNGDNPDLYVVSQEDGYQEVIFTQAADYEMGMTAHISLCQDYIRKTIKVMSPEVAEMQRQMQEQLGTNMNLEVNVFPNPNYGRFRVESELNQQQNIKIHIFDLNKGRIITSISGKNSKHYVFDFDDQNLAEGVYLVMAESEGKTITKKFIVK